MITTNDHEHANGHHHIEIRALPPSPASGRRSISTSDLERLERLGCEELFRLKQPLRQALLVVVAQESRQCCAIFFETIGPVVVAHFAARLFDVMGKPGQHGFQRRRFGEIVIGALLRRAERLEERLRDPAICLVDVAPDGDRVHDRKNPGLSVIGAFDLGIILEQPHDTQAVVGGRFPCGMEGVDLAVAQHLRERLVLGDRHDLDIGRQIERLLFRPPGLFFDHR